MYRNSTEMFDIPVVEIRATFVKRTSVTNQCDYLLHSGATSCIKFIVYMKYKSDA